MGAYVFQQMISQLEERLTGDLPGAKAHDLMMPRPIRGSRDGFRHANIPKEGAVMLLLYEQDGEIQFPLIKRPIYSGIHSGQISLPGGKPESKDPHLIATALRETEEEVGIQADQIKVIGSLSTLYISASHFNVKPVVGYLQMPPTFTPDPREVVNIFNMPLSQILGNQHKKEMGMSFPSYDLISPYYDLQGEVVWGATAMIISEFAEILSEIRYSF